MNSDFDFDPLRSELDRDPDLSDNPIDREDLSLDPKDRLRGGR